MKKSSREVDLVRRLSGIFDPPPGVNRRAFLIRHATIGAAAILTGKTWTPEARAQRAAAEASTAKLGATLSPDLNLVKAEKGPIMTVLDEFYKVDRGRRVRTRSDQCASRMISISVAELPADQLARATGLKVHLFGLSRPARVMARSGVAGWPGREGAGDG